MLKRTDIDWLERIVWCLVIILGGFWLWSQFQERLVLADLATFWRQMQATFTPEANRLDRLLLPTAIGGTFVFCLKTISPQPLLWSRATISILLVGLGVRYELWRLFNTLNLSDPLNGTLSILLFVMELMAFTNTAAFMLQTIPSIDRSPEADRLSQAVISEAYQPWVDVLIPTYNEPPEVLRRTIIGCQAMKYDHKRVYLLDDLRRPHIRELAQELDCNYIIRPNNDHAKAGNLNHGIAKTDGDLIVVFDADFIPTTNFLTRTVGFFQDAKVALLQTPQNFYNEDPIGVNLGLQEVLTNEQALFFRYIQPSRDVTNSVICCGSSFVIRRTALAEIGGIPTESITEDFFTSLKLQSLGYKIKYLNEALSAGMSPENMGAYIDQRLRWGQGTLQSMFCPANVFTIPGLSLLQRVSHSLGLLYWCLSVPRFIFLVMPLSYLLFELAPLRATIDGVLFFYLPYFVCNAISFSWMTEGRRSAFWSDVYETILCIPMMLTVIQTLRNPFGKAFKVTPKGIAANRLHINWHLLLPLVVLIVLSLFGLGMRIFYAPWSTANPDSLKINIVWTTYNLILLYICVLVNIDVPQRQHSRFDRQFPCELQINGEWLLGRSINISEGGAAVRLNRKWKQPPADKLGLLRIPGLKTELKVEIRWKQNSDSGPFFVGLRFIECDVVQLRSLIPFLYCQPNQWTEQKVPEHLTVWALFQSVFRLYALAESRG